MSPAQEREHPVNDDGRDGGKGVLEPVGHRRNSSGGPRGRLDRLYRAGREVDCLKNAPARNNPLSSGVQFDDRFLA